jgi:enterochelin esterase-like enzyme
MMAIRKAVCFGVLAASLWFGTAVVLGQTPPRNSGGNSLVSPEIQADHRVTFRVAAPKATQVALNGDWEGGNGVALNKDAQGFWSVTVGPLAPELWSYAFDVDGVRMLDPANVDNSRDGRRLSSIFLIPGPASALYEHNPNIPHGTVSHVWYPAPSLRMTRRMYVYTPPGYENSTSRYPVLYLHPGGTSDEDAWTSLGRLPQILDGLIAQGKAKPMIVVMQNLNPRQWAAPGYALGLPPESAAAPAPARPAPGANQRRPGTGADQRSPDNWPLNPTQAAIAESIAKDLIPFVEKTYRVDARSESRAIAGLSQGGGPVVLATNNNPKQFGYIGLFSSRPLFEEPELKALNALKAAGAVKLYWVSAGDTDFAHDGSKKDFEVIQKIGFNARWLETHGAHTWITWRMHISQLAPLLFR